MKIIIKGVENHFDEDTLTNREAMELEKVTGGTFTEFSDALKNGSILALTALVWVIQRRDNPQLRFSEVEFSFGDLEIVGDDEDETAIAPDPTPPA